VCGSSGLATLCAQTDSPRDSSSGGEWTTRAQALNELLESDSKYGFIVMDGNGSLYGTLSGNAREILHKFSVDLPKKHGRGGQSALRFARLRLEKRHNYVRKVRVGTVLLACVAW
jgi:peptide subunit release factor 1 (eRF1)